MFEIENVDIMTIPRKGKGVPRSPLGKAICDLEVGQSFLALDSLGKARSHYSGCISNAKVRLGRKFSMRRVEGGYRIGRVA